MYSRPFWISRVVERDVALDAIEHGGRDGSVALRRVLIGDALDVIRDAEDLLHDDDAAFRLALRLGEVRVELVPVLGLQPNHLAHDSCSLCESRAADATGRHRGMATRAQSGANGGARRQGSGWLARSLDRDGA